MQTLKAIGSELFGLFFDDIGFALSILGWLLVAGLGLPRLGLPNPLPGILLFAGLGAILIESAVRRSR